MVDGEQIKIFCLDTANLFVKLYPWYIMPTSIHVILLHVHQIIKIFDLPIGMLSEEAQESKNKYIKSYRKHHTRKSSRLEKIKTQFLIVMCLKKILFQVKN